jgi:hypothetical protein
MEGKVLAAMGGCAVIAAAAYILQGGKKIGYNRKDHSGIYIYNLL